MSLIYGVEQFVLTHIDSNEEGSLDCAGGRTGIAWPKGGALPRR